jgi:hypothetical protein
MAFCSAPCLRTASLLVFPAITLHFRFGHDLGYGTRHSPGINPNLYGIGFRFLYMEVGKAHCGIVYVIPAFLIATSWRCVRWPQGSTYLTCIDICTYLIQCVRSSCYIISRTTHSRRPHSHHSNLNTERGLSLPARVSHGGYTSKVTKRERLYYQRSRICWPNERSIPPCVS